jgi:hypothetical protein
MMRKMMTKEVTITTVKIAKMESQNGLPKAISLPDEVMLGNVSLEQAHKHVFKKFGSSVTVFEVQPETRVYELEVEEFIKVARVRK